jgi:colanic acid/amylovoran biosynthesis glycosyltransferase
MFASCITNITYSISLLGPTLETYGPNQRNKWRFASFGLFQSHQLLHDAERKLSVCLPALYRFAPVGVNTDVMKRDNEYQPWIKPDIPVADSPN